MKSITNTLTFGLAVCLVLAATSCKNQRPDPPFGIEATTPAGMSLEKWFAGDELGALSVVDANTTTPTGLYVRGEVANENGDVEAAYKHWRAMLEQHPSHPLTRTAAARLYAVRNDVVDFESRIWDMFEKLDYTRLQPLSRLYVSMLQQTIAYRRWKRSESTEPFDTDRFGFAAKWLRTPRLSPWRLRDFDTAFAPETSDTLATEYLSDAYATDAQKNYEDVTPYWTGGITLYPGFTSTGVHYLETYATVEGTGARDYLLYGNFTSATRVWIDGELIFDRAEGDYDTGKRLRRIRLEPGSHRVLVKLAYQSGYRDWFDLSFIPEGTSTSDSGLVFQYRCMEGRQLPGCLENPAPTDRVEVLTEAMRPAELEQILVAPDDVEKATDIGLWVTMINAYFDGQNAFFEPAWDELQERRPEFAAGWSLWSEHVETLWQVPSRLRDARSMQALRKARELNPDSVRYATDLGARLTKNGEDREARALLEEALSASVSDGQLRYMRPMLSWAQYLGEKGWQTESEKAWRTLLEADPSNCRAAQELQSLMYGRSEYKKPEEITPRAADCPDLEERYIQLDDTDVRGRMRLARKEALRDPLDTGKARNYARLLWQSGASDEARQVIDAALAVTPHSATLRAELADRVFAEGDTEGALKILEEYEVDEGTPSWLIWKRSNMTGDIPLMDIMPDGLAAAKKAVADGQTKSLSNDEAYFVVDFAARQYFPDGSKLTLTHTVVRVMTKNAIDRYGEQNLPGGARPLLVRTIKQDGTVRVPAETAGKSTLSMPGLAEGDFVEVAYIEYDNASTPPSHVEGVRFFFQMQNISTLHSEYVVIGDIAEFMIENDAPQPERFSYKGMPAVRFLAKDNPRPRAEPRTPPVEEYLPWIQMYRQGRTLGEIEVYRRNVHEAILDSSKSAEAFEDALAEWTNGELPEVGSIGWLRHVFYAVAGHIPEPSISPRSFNTDVNHAILEKDGNSMLVLKKVLDRYEVPNDVYLVKTAYAVPEVYPIREDNKYGSVLLRVQATGGEVVWLVPQGPDAMFNAVGDALIGQPAICATCEEPNELVIPDDVRRSTQSIAVESKLARSGELTGRITFEFEGETAASIRSGLRSRTDEASRVKFVDSLAAGVFPGSSATAYDIQSELNPDAALVILVDFRRPAFAREVAKGRFQVETTLFQNGVASVFAALPERTTPLLVGFPIHRESTLTMDLSEWNGAEITSRSGTQQFDTGFGTASRSATVEGDTLQVRAQTNMPIQRVPPTAYRAFQQWALTVEQSALLRVELR